MLLRFMNVRTMDRNHADTAAAITGAGPAPEPGRPIPWEDPDLPRMAGLFRTLREVLLRPGDFFQNLGGAGWAEPLAFSLIIGTAGCLAGIFWHLVLDAALGLPGEGPGTSPFLTLSRGVMVALMVLAPVMVLAHQGIGSLCLWGSLKLVGAAPGFVPVWRVTAYAQGGMATACIPLLGVPLAGLWVLMLVGQGVQTVWGMSLGRTLLVLALFLLLQTLLVVCLVVCLAGGLAALVALLGLLLFLG